MADPRAERLKRAMKLVDVLDESSVSRGEIKRAIDRLIKYVQDSKKEWDDAQTSYKAKVSTAFEKLLGEVGTLETKLLAKVAEARSFATSEANRVSDRLDREVAAVRRDFPKIPKMPQMPKVPNVAPIYERLRKIDERMLTPEVAEEIRNKLELLPDGEKLSPDAVEGLQKWMGEMGEKIGTALGKASGGPRGIHTFVDGIKKGLVSTFNFKAGSNMAIAYSTVNGMPTLTFTSSGGGAGSTVETPAETPNGVTTAFTVSAEPKWMVADGTTYFANAGYAYAALTVTFDVPPSASVRAII